MQMITASYRRIKAHHLQNNLNPLLLNVLLFDFNIVVICYDWWNSWLYDDKQNSEFFCGTIFIWSIECVRVSVCVFSLSLEKTLNVEHGSYTYCKHMHECTHTQHTNTCMKFDSRLTETLNFVQDFNLTVQSKHMYMVYTVYFVLFWIVCATNVHIAFILFEFLVNEKKNL